jgi:hypothetical protein
VLEHCHDPGITKVSDYLLRIRLGLAAAVILSVTATALLIWALLRGDPPAFAFMAVWFAALVVLGGLISLAAVRDNHPAVRAARPRRFLVHNGAFVAPWSRTRLPVSMLAIVSVPLLFGRQLADLVRTEEPADFSSPVHAFGIAALMLIIFVHVILSSRQASDLVLTPEGILWRNTLLRRFIPWPALAAGGPPRPRSTAKELFLVVARPELVTNPGIRLMPARPIRYPAIDLTAGLQPDFLADAIRWYVEHPADRAAIGTTAEHDRLVTALSPSEPATQAR